MLNDDKDVANVVSDWLADAKRVVIIGIGDELRRDDFVGVEVVKRLRGNVPRHVMLIESETVPESDLETIARFHPTHTLLIDAGLVDLEPGQVKLTSGCSTLGSTAAVSTHMLPLRVFCEYLETIIGTRVMLIIIQPETTDFGEGLTESVRETAERLAQTLTSVVQQS
jgi:hydrogenase 3 maturation protease